MIEIKLNSKGENKSNISEKTILWFYDIDFP